MLSVPVSVWEDHLLPLLMSKDAARLACSCKALREMARERFKDLGKIKLWKLQAALTSFPRARTVVPQEIWPDAERAQWGDEGRRALFDWLCEEERGRYLEEMTETVYFSSDARKLLHEALQSGALPSLRRIKANLEDEVERRALMGGFLGGMHELRVDIELRLPWGDDENDGFEDDLQDVKIQLEALGMVRHLPALAKLEVRKLGEDGDHVQWPNFIPPSLKALSIDVDEYAEFLTPDSLLPALPGMLAASGARLDRLEMLVPANHDEMIKGLVHVASALRCCSPTLKEFLFKTGYPYGQEDEDSDEGQAQVERLRVPWADVLAGVSACRELEVLVLPSVMAEPLFSLGTAFSRLTHLEISDYERAHPPDAGVMGLWELMASGGLPALAKLYVNLEGRWRGTEDVRTQVAPALEAVAGTLTHFCVWFTSELLIENEVAMGYELGVAMGKLRRLKDLSLSLTPDGRVYHALAQGLAASGGERPLPLLWRMGAIHQPVFENPDLLASLLLPSVRVFALIHTNREYTIVTACALRRAGYKHTWRSRDDVEMPPPGFGSFRVFHMSDVLKSDMPAWTLCYTDEWE
jgi:hypothetical protein